MNRTTQSVLIALLGGSLLSITVTGRFTAYVKPGFGPLLLLGGSVLIVVGVLSIGFGLRSDRNAEHETGADIGTAAEPGSHEHSHERSKAPWLILAPILVLLLLSPPALGADAVRRNAGSQALAGVGGVTPQTGSGADVAAGGTPGGYAPNDGSGRGIGTANFAKKRPTMSFPALPAGKDPTLTLKEFILRALYDGDNSVSDNDITVVGFIAPTDDGYAGGYSLARVTISCCAADASPLRVHVDGAPKFPTDTWVTAVISAQPGTADQDNNYVPTVDLTAISRVRQPADPYEH